MVACETLKLRAISACESLVSFFTLVCGQSRGTAEFHSTGLCAASAVARAGKDQLSLELG